MQRADLLIVINNLTQLEYEQEQERRRMQGEIAQIQLRINAQQSILCRTREKLAEYLRKYAILCNQENAVETPVEPVCVASATSEPNEQKEA